MSGIFTTLFSIFHPHKCTFCRKAIDYNNHTFICASCMKSLPFIDGQRCLKCGTPVLSTAMPVCSTCRKYHHSFSGAFTPLLYKDKVRRAIIGMKFHDKESFCHSFSYLIANRIIEEGFPDFDFITYIPLSPESYKERGFNQSLLIAEECGKILNLPVIDTLTRVNGTPRQSTLSMTARRSNAKKAFKPKPVSLSGTALLIDDVYTTGSTMSYTSSLLLKMGCKKVYIACVAINPRN